MGPAQFPVAFVAFAVALVGACGPEPAPDAPTYEADVKPIVLSRCVRCHNAATLTAASTPDSGFVPDPAFPFIPSDGAFESYDAPTVVCTSLRGACRGLGAFTEPVDAASANIIKKRIHGSVDYGYMPPPPAPVLTERQLEIMDRWIANPLR